MTDETPDEDMSRAKRAGDNRRTLEAVVYYAAGETEALGQVLAEAREVRRSHHFTFALLENLGEVLRLRDNPENVEPVRAEIERLIAVENTTEGDDE